MSAQRSDNSQGDTGTRDITYDLVSVIYHALQGAETTALYIADAEQEGNQELVAFFTEAKDEYQRRGDRAKQLLATHLGSQQGRGASGGGGGQS
ncbi:MAG TPA: hypothetical protein VGB98_24445 [Pyrinomonadaceae bacterium]|jgi:hypothetical protein